MTEEEAAAAAKTIGLVVAGAQVQTRQDGTNYGVVVRGDSGDGSEDEVMMNVEEVADYLRDNL